MNDAEHQRAHVLFEQQVHRFPNSLAIVCGAAALTYSQLNTRANQLAHHLRDLGLQPGALVGICVRRSVEMAVGILGILKAGGAWVPMDERYPADRLALADNKYDPQILLKVDGVCQKCHDTDNDPSFRFEERWPKIVHGKKPAAAAEKTETTTKKQ